MGKYFGTDGFRGEANVDLKVTHAYKVGRYLGYYYGKNHEDGKASIVIGKDTRRSSYMFEYSLCLSYLYFLNPDTIIDSKYNTINCLDSIINITKMRLHDIY